MNPVSEKARDLVSDMQLSFLDACDRFIRNETQLEKNRNIVFVVCTGLPDTQHLSKTRKASRGGVAEKMNSTPSVMDFRIHQT